MPINYWPAASPKAEHPMPCSKCRKVFDAWGYTLSQRTRGPWRGLCASCKETANLKGWAGKEEA